MSKTPRVYVSYSMHTPGQRERAFELAERMRAAGIDGRIDQYFSRSLHGFVPPKEVDGDQRPAWMVWQEREIAGADVVVVACSAEYAAARERSGVWFDLKYMHEDIARRGAPRGKFIPAGYGPYGAMADKLPAFLRDAHYHDLSEPTGIDDLVRRIRTEAGLPTAADAAPPPATAPAAMAAPATPEPPEPPEPKVARHGIFVSYSHQDKKWLEALKKMLSPLIRDGSLDLWDDTRIKTGDLWREQIDRALASAKVAVLLVSADFLASEFIAKHEFAPLLEAARAKGLKICWVYVSSALYEATEIARYQAAHDVGKPLDRLSRDQRQAVLSKVAHEIRELAR